MTGKDDVWLDVEEISLHYGYDVQLVKAQIRSWTNTPYVEKHGNTNFINVSHFERRALAYTEQWNQAHAYYHLMAMSMSDYDMAKVMHEKRGGSLSTWKYFFTTGLFRRIDEETIFTNKHITGMSCFIKTAPKLIKELSDEPMSAVRLKAR